MLFISTNPWITTCLMIRIICRSISSNIKFSWFIFIFFNFSRSNPLRQIHINSETS